MIQISEIIEWEKEKNAKLRNDIKTRFKFNINSNDFMEIFILYANRTILERGIDKDFELNSFNKEIINQFHYYITGDENNFNGKIWKGIMIVGKNGTGKTLLLRSLFKLINNISKLSVYQIHSKLLNEYIKEKGIDSIRRKPLYIDDIGKESKEINDFGTKILPMADLIALRYDSGALTFATCNYKLETLTEFYGLTTTDRMKEMFNIIELKGESFRK